MKMKVYDRNMTKKNHARAQGMAQVTLALEADLLENLTEIAKSEQRSRNRQIVKMLKDRVDDYYRQNPQAYDKDEDKLAG